MDNGDIDMDKIIYFENGNQNVDRCTGKIYFDFLDYAFSKTDFFMLVYVNYGGKGYTKNMKSFKNELAPFQVKTRTNPSWPGTLNTYSANTTYKIIFYKTTSKAKEILKKVCSLSDWSSPFNPQDLAFFKGNQCWFYSVGHEKIAAIIHATNDDLGFLECAGLATANSAKDRKNDYFDAYNEIIVK